MLLRSGLYSEQIIQTLYSDSNSLAGFNLSYKNPEGVSEKDYSLKGNCFSFQEVQTLTSF